MAESTIHGRETTRLIFGVVGSLAALVAIHVTLYLNFVVPSTLRQVAEIVDRKIQIHRTYAVHPGAVRREEFKLIIERLDRVARRLDNATK